MRLLAHHGFWRTNSPCWTRWSTWQPIASGWELLAGDCESGSLRWLLSARWNLKSFCERFKSVLFFPHPFLFPWCSPIAAKSKFSRFQRLETQLTSSSLHRVFNGSSRRSALVVLCFGILPIVLLQVELEFLMVPRPSKNWEIQLQSSQLWRQWGHGFIFFRIWFLLHRFIQLVAALGVVAPGASCFVLCDWLLLWSDTAVDPFSGQPCKFLTPIRGDVLNEVLLRLGCSNLCFTDPNQQAYFEANKWDDWDRRSWQDLVAQCPSVLASDNPGKFFMFSVLFSDNKRKSLRWVSLLLRSVSYRRLWLIMRKYMFYSRWSFSHLDLWQVAFQPPPPPQYYPPGPK